MGNLCDKFSYIEGMNFFPGFSCFKESSEADSICNPYTMCGALSFILYYTLQVVDCKYRLSLSSGIQEHKQSCRHCVFLAQQHDVFVN